MTMTEAAGGADEAKWLRWRSVADLYHAYFTGLVLTVVTRRGTTDAAEFVFRVFRRQQQERFLPGLEGHGDLRRARRSVARDAAGLARQQRRFAGQPKARLCLHQAERRRTGRIGRLL